MAFRKRKSGVFTDRNIIINYYLLYKNPEANNLVCSIINQNHFLTHKLTSWSVVERCGAVWSVVERCGALWSVMERCGALWSVSLVCLGVREATIVFWFERWVGRWYNLVWAWCRRHRNVLERWRAYFRQMWLIEMCCYICWSFVFCGRFGQWDVRELLVVSHKVACAFFCCNCGIRWWVLFWFETWMHACEQ